MEVEPKKKPRSSPAIHQERPQAKKTRKRKGEKNDQTASLKRPAAAKRKCGPSAGSKRKISAPATPKAKAKAQPMNPDKNEGLRKNAWKPPTRERVYSSVYHYHVARGKDKAEAASLAREECDKQGLLTKSRKKATSQKDS